MKSELGQFYTKNCDYILRGLEVPQGIEVVEPFVGEGDLLEWINSRSPSMLEVYDIDPKVQATQQDTLLNPPDYRGKYVVTNPPYLARNKNKDKTLYDKWQVGDLYKAFLKTVVEGDAEGGVVIIPLNFLCDRDSSIRDTFFSKYTILKMNVFEEQVFDDTTYTVCSFMFVKGPQTSSFTATFYPSEEQSSILIEKKYGWRIGGKLHRKVNSDYQFGRLTQEHRDDPSKQKLKFDTTLYLYAVDSGSPNGRIRLVSGHDPYYGKDTDRAFATIICNKEIKNPKELAEKFNNLLEKRREEYRSLFLTNFRNSTKHYARKRISFALVFNFLKELL